MKRRWGYDPKSKFLFSLDGEFRFEGKSVDSPGADEVHAASDDFETRVAQELSGCVFLSGWRRDCLALRMGLREDETYGMVGRLRGRSATVRGRLDAMSAMVSKGSPVCLCGPAVKDPERVAEVCRAFPTERVYVCSLVDELAAFGALVVSAAEESPRRLSFFVPNADRIEAPFVEFDPKLDGDGYGRMADVVRKGMPALNEMMKGPGVSPFYGRVLVDGLGGMSTYVLPPQDAEKFFPKEPVSSKVYAATCVPVRMANTDAFAKASGWNGDWIDVVVSSGMIPEIQTFTRFYVLMSGRAFFGSAPAEEVATAVRSAPVFRSDRAYRVGMNGEGKFDVGRAVQG